VDEIRKFLESSEPLRLFLVICSGFLMGQIRIRGFKLGVSGVLFAGLFLGAWCPEDQKPFTIAHQVLELGLILFVYMIGLNSGAGFFASFKSHGLRFNLAMVCALLAGAAVTLLVGIWMELEAGQISGVYCGGLTNTPALAAVLELAKNSGIGKASEPAVGYSISYPFGILGGLLAFQIFTWAYRSAAEKERTEAALQTRARTSLVTATFNISNPELFNKAIGLLRVQDRTGLIISRLRHGDTVTIPTKYSILQEGDMVGVVGTELNIRQAESYFGGRSREQLEDLRSSEIEMRRILISNKKLAGLTIEQLDLDRSFNAQITRLRRADVDIIPDDSTLIQVGDRVRVVMPKGKSAEVAKFFGDSERDKSQLDYMALTLGISLGVLIGMVPIPVPGGTYVSLGFAGGPLVAGLILGKLGRTGPFVWSIPAEANQALSHMGLLFFLAAVGVMAGGRFFQALSSHGLQLFTLGFLTTTVTTALALLLLRHPGKGTIVQSIGATSGMQTQPATLARAHEMSRSDETFVAYATTYPVAMVGKILIAQLLMILANSLA